MAYRKVDTRVWDDEKLADEAPLTKLVWLYVLTGPHTTALPGLWVAGAGAIADGLRLSPAETEAAMARLEAIGLIERDVRLRVLRVPNAPRYNAPENAATIKAWFGHWSRVPDCALKVRHLASLRAAVGGTSDRAVSLLAAWDTHFSDACNAAETQEFAPAREARPNDSPPSSEAFAIDSRSLRDHLPNRSPAPALLISGSVDPEIHKGSGNRAREGTKPAKAQPPREPKAHERYAEAYAAGMREASGQPFSQPRGKADLVEMATTYARIPGGAAIVGAELLAWFRETAAAYRLACPNGQFQGGYDPAHCLRWLNAGRPDDRGRVFGRPSMRQPAAASEPAWTPQDGSQARAILTATDEEWAAMCAEREGIRLNPRS